MERIKIFCFMGNFGTICCFLLISIFPLGTDGLNSESESSVNGSSSNLRYQLAVFDFQRVELPFVICLWILIVSLAKIAT
ncbi:hypothetical protein KUTeg_019778 [Tegillarca granosa]|uniref:Uncharacterized protein n=1 Tax=Tegillarca granosa TaxID=220873 RepID=A0ABQ9EDK0_TEGGR|nr:hypothetical protein KUTeg_019778 [Tegillarca granosa]